MNSNGSHQYGPAIVADNGKIIQGNVYHNNYFELKQARVEETRKFYYSQNARKNHVYTASSSTCEWIWTTVFARWLRIKKAKVFWISGKPGSGKSTLMKYLSQPSAIEKRLPSQPSDWIVIDFFFDFRLSEQTGNDLDSLLRSLLFQLVEELPGVDRALYENLVLDPSKSLECLEVAFKTALNLSNRSVLLLIDGLDEFAGKIGPLLEFFFRVKNCQNIKLCLASRPEPMIFESFSCLPKIAMSDYNSQGIRHYVDAVINRYQPRLNILRNPEIEDLILQRADGVFLWVHLVMDEIIEACAGGAGKTELMEKLELLPAELELLYGRILKRIPKVQKRSAAMVFFLIDNAIRHVTLELLQHTLIFISCELKLLQDFEWVDLEHFQRWLRGTMCGLVDSVPGQDERFPGTQAQYPTLRLIHRTLRSYSKTSGWFLRNLPDRMRDVDSSLIWPYICSKAILGIGIPSYSLVNHKISSLEGRWLTYDAFVGLLKHISPVETISRWTALLFHSIIYIPMHAELAALYGTRAVQDLVDDALSSPLACIHYAITGGHYPNVLQPIKISLSQGISDLMLAAAHRNIRCLKNRKPLIRKLNDNQRREIVTMMVMVFGLRSECPGQCEDDDDKESERELIESILSFDRHVSPFHLAVYLRLGYDSMPQFLHQPIMRGQLCPSSVPQISPWAGAPRLFGREAPIFIWACEYTKSNPEQTCRAQLQVLCFFSLDINAKSSTGQNVIHYLISRHIIGHTFLEKGNDCACLPRDDLAEATEKLYALEEAGADFTEQFEHRTPLQAFRHGVDIIRRAEETAYDIPEERFVHMEFILEHKEKTGHLPKPMLGTKFWRNVHIPLLLEQKCDVCTGSAPSPSLSLATITDAQKSESSLTSPPRRPARPSSTPSPSRIPRLVKTAGGRATPKEH